jgi:hypothetical protein
MKYKVTAEFVATREDADELLSKFDNYPYESVSIEDTSDFNRYKVIAKFDLFRDEIRDLMDYITKNLYKTVQINSYDENQ